MKKLKNIFITVILTLIILFSSLYIFVHIYKKEIIDGFIKVANHHLKTEITADISIDIFAKFPQISISMADVKIKGSLKSKKENMAEIEKIYLSIALIDFLKLDYKIRDISVHEGFINLYVDEFGQTNYNFFESNSADTTAEGISFKIEQIALNDLLIKYDNKKLRQKYELYTYNANGDFSIDNALTNINISSFFEVEKFTVGDYNYFENKKVKLKTQLLLNNEKEDISFSKSRIYVENSEFSGDGIYNMKDDTYKIKIEGEKTGIQTIISLLPNSVAENFSNYKSTGDLVFSCSIFKELKIDVSPKINIQFNCKNMTITEPKSGSILKKLNMEGYFTNGNERSNTSSSLFIKNINGEVDGQTFNGYFKYLNFDNPFIEMALTGNFKLQFIKDFFTISEINNPAGNIGVNLTLKAKQKDLQEGKAKKINAFGNITFNNTKLSSSDDFYNFKNINGKLIFDMYDIKVSQISGIINSSDFLINGEVKNLFGYVLNDKQSINIIADLKSEKMNFNNLVRVSAVEDKQSAKGIENEYLKYITFDFNSQINSFVWGRFLVKETVGHVRLKDLVFSSSNISGKAADGSFKINGTVDAKDKNNITVKTNAILDGVSIDSSFHYFYEFGQDFITSKHIHGKMLLNINSTLVFDSLLNIKPGKIIAEITAKVTDGSLTNFEPMQNMSKFIKEDELRNVKFSELNNTIYIKDQTITIPMMDIKSSASNIKIEGTHTFDQKIFYRVKIPLKNFVGKRNKDNEGAIEDTKDGTTLHLIVKGTTDDFSILYDTQATKQVIKEKFNEEIKEVKDALKNNPKYDEKQVELEEEDYFDFEGDSI